VQNRQFGLGCQVDQCISINLTLITLFLEAPRLAIPHKRKASLFSVRTATASFCSYDNDTLDLFLFDRHVSGVIIFLYVRSFGFSFVLGNLIELFVRLHLLSLHDHLNLDPINNSLGQNNYPGG